MSRRRVLLIVPPTGLYIREDRCQTPIEEMKTIALRPPIDLMYSAASTERAGCECRLVDYPAERKTWTDLERDIMAFHPHVLMISVTTPSLARDLVAAEVAKRIDPSILTVAKGAHFLVYDREALERYPALDCVIRGEYELTAAELGQGRPLDQIQGITYRQAGGTIVQNPPRPLIEDLDSIPFPARHLVRNELYFRPDTMEPQTTIVTNRGCPHSCIYCLAPVVSGKKNRYRSVANVLAELVECVERFGIRNFLFRSDLFTQNKKWVIELCQAIVDRRLNIEWASNSRVDTIDAELLGWMKRAGCWIIAYGVESGNQEMLDLMKKKATVEQARRAIQLTREAGIKSSVYFLMGLPWDKPETLEDNVRFAQELLPDFVEIFYTYPFPGTELYRIAVEHGLLQAGETPEEAYARPAIGGFYMSREELAKWRKKALRRIYLQPRYIWRTLASVRSPKEFVNYVKYGALTFFDLLRGGESGGKEKAELRAKATD
ncbi:MAG: B12-binding domain-containing radical SAM protein [Candidatus Sumerlaeaceae bacterium]|nr:B12-binding domain-containing radical SAM protein [Candidatus Sumerlaeaceae bacterium]